VPVKPACDVRLYQVIAAIDDDRETARLVAQLVVRLARVPPRPKPPPGR